MTKYFDMYMYDNLVDLAVQDWPKQMLLIPGSMEE
jgi:hypothetical protein